MSRKARRMRLVLVLLLASAWACTGSVQLLSNPDSPHVITVNSDGTSHAPMWTGAPMDPSYFSVMDVESGAHPLYIGPVYKFIRRTVPETTRTFDISEYYDLTVGREYRVCSVASTSGGFKCTQFLHQQPFREVEPMTTSNGNCTTIQESIVEQARLDAMSAMHRGFNDYIRGRNCFGDDYVEWFGEPDPWRHLEVVLTFNSVALTLSRRSAVYNFTVDCSPPQCTFGTTVAYVYPNFRDPNQYRYMRIYLCPYWWNNATEGADTFNSKGGTLVHEASHLKPGVAESASTVDVIFSTDDHRYGPSDCRSLANRSPALAVDNADNFEYFIESGADVSECASNACSAANETACLDKFMCGYCNNTACIPGHEFGPLNYTSCTTTQCITEAPIVCTDWKSSISTFSSAVGIAPPWMLCAVLFAFAFASARR